VLVNRLFFFLFRFSLCWITYIYTRLTKGPTRNSHLLCLCEIVTIKKKKKKARKKSFFIFILFLFFTSVFSGAQKKFFFTRHIRVECRKAWSKKKAQHIWKRHYYVNNASILMYCTSFESQRSSLSSGAYH
jgi:hypothetical protein